MTHFAWPTRGTRAGTESVTWILARTVSLYAQAREGLPVLQGTGVLLKIGDVGFILSAAHTFTEILKDRRRVLAGVASLAPTRVPMISLEGAQIASSRDKDDVDIAFIRLTNDQVDELGRHKQFLSLDQVDLVPFPPVPGWYAVLGFPVEQSSRDQTTQLIASDPLCLHTTLYEEDLRHEQFTIGTSIALSIAPNRTSDESGEPSRLPALGGISGGGIWCIATKPEDADDAIWTTDSIRLAGIEHTIVGRQKLIKGVLAFHVIWGIRRRYPELAPAVAAARRPAIGSRPFLFRSRQV